jgi:hypothetical protein
MRSHSCDGPETHLQQVVFNMETLSGVTSVMDEINQISLSTKLERPPQSVKDRLMRRIKSGQVTAA